MGSKGFLGFNGHMPVFAQNYDGQRSTNKGRLKLGFQRVSTSWIDYRDVSWYPTIRNFQIGFPNLQTIHFSLLVVMHRAQIYCGFASANRPLSPVFLEAEKAETSQQKYRKMSCGRQQLVIRILFVLKASNVIALHRSVWQTRDCFAVQLNLVESLLRPVMSGLRYHKKKMKKLPESPRTVLNRDRFFQGLSGMAITRFYLQDLQDATNNFRIKRGHGGFGSVYLRSSSRGLKLAVKKLESIAGKKEFRAEELHSFLLTSYHGGNGSLIDGFSVINNEGLLIGTELMTREPEPLFTTLRELGDILHREMDQKIVHIEKSDCLQLRGCCYSRYRAAGKNYDSHKVPRNSTSQPMLSRKMEEGKVEG
nr:G-type lectin S-receptor-like serine/threonine-protein kinase SD2-5 [Ipomoea batatas]